MATKSQGDRSGKQLSTQQVFILMWMLARESEAQSRNKGIPWTAEAFLGRKASSNESSSISRALRLLEKRGLIVRKDGTVRFTKEGRAKAEGVKKNDGLTERDIELRLGMEVTRARIEALKMAQHHVASKGLELREALGPVYERTMTDEQRGEIEKLRALGETVYYLGDLLLDERNKLYRLRKKYNESTRVQVLQKQDDIEKY